MEIWELKNKIYKKMKKGKKKKKVGDGFKVTVKSEDTTAEKTQKQKKKKLLEDKYFIQKTKINDAVRFWKKQEHVL